MYASFFVVKNKSHEMFATYGIKQSCTITLKVKHTGQNDRFVFLVLKVRIKFHWCKHSQSNVTSLSKNK